LTIEMFHPELDASKHVERESQAAILERSGWVRKDQGHYFEHEFRIERASSAVVRPDDFVLDDEGTTDKEE
jgi:hypothetical protein